MAGELEFSPSVESALVWASGCARIGSGTGSVTPDDLFVGLLLAHPDRRGEVWQLLEHFGLTARDLLPDDYRVIDAVALEEIAAAARAPDPSDWDPQVASLLGQAKSRAGGTAQVLHVLAVLLQETPWPDRLQEGLTRFRISANEVVRELNEIVPSLAATEGGGSDQVDLASSTPAGEQIGRWLAQRFPRQPATLASFSNDAPDPGSDFIGVSEEADAFAYLIASRTLVPPLAIGLFGHWGSGKSFLMAKIRQRVGQLTELAAQEPQPTATDAMPKQLWSKVVPIEFNAWQYVETDLWAALLSRVFEQLSPQAREQLTELARRRQELLAQEDASLQEQLRAELAVSDLRQKVVAEQETLTTAETGVAHAKQNAAVLATAASREALETHAKDAATSALAGAIERAVDPEVVEALRSARRLKVAAATPVWRRREFWTWRRVGWVAVALLLVPILVVALDRFGLPTALAAALGTAAAVLSPMLRTAADFIQDQQKAALAGAQRVEDELARIVASAERARTEAEESLTATRRRLEAEQQNLATSTAARLDLSQMAARLTSGSVYAEYLSGRHTSEDYRKRLGIVTTVSDDLEKLSSLINDYNQSDQGGQPDGPPNRIVLYIDDLDRCPPSRVVEVLEAVHLLLAFPLFVVIVAVDTRWLTAALSEALPILQKRAEPHVDAPTATDYVEKIFQIPFWVEPLDDTGRQRLLRGLLLPSVAEPTASPGVDRPTVVAISAAQRQAATAMLTTHGSWLDADARRFAITVDELAFLQSLNPLLKGTPRQIKRFVNICKLLLAMSPPLEGGEKPATERTVACFMAAVHQSMPTLATRLARAAESAAPGATILSALTGITNADVAADRLVVFAWLETQSEVPPVEPFRQARATMLLNRWDVIRRLRFAEEELE